MQRRRLATLSLGLLLVFLTNDARAEPRLAVVVPASREVELSRDEVAQIYLKQRRFWSDGSPIVPINREASSRARKAFVRGIFGNHRHLAVYWNRQYFQGVLPPATLASEDAVKRFVSLEPNAIGYIREDQVDDALRVLFTLPFP